MDIMRPFISKDGRYIEPKPHIATFRGRHNAVKSKVFIYLYHNEGQYIPAREIADNTGTSYNYLETRLVFWYRIRYLDRKPLVVDSGHPVWGYKIVSRGIHFLQHRIPSDKYQEYITEIKESRRINASQRG